MKANHELPLFLLVGAVATIADFSLYFLLMSLGLDSDISKVTSFIVGTWVGYIGNSRVTFSQRSGKVTVYLMVYAFSLIVNVWVNNLAHSTSENAPLSWLLATFSSTSINFIGLRYLAFSRKV
jgi:putative flippase GtrA